MGIAVALVAAVLIRWKLDENEQGTKKPTDRIVNITRTRSQLHLRTDDAGWQCTRPKRSQIPASAATRSGRRLDWNLPILITGHDESVA